MFSNRTCPLKSNADSGTDLAYLHVLKSTDVTSVIVPPGLRPQLHIISILPPSPLDNDIHPLFRQSRWPGLKSEYYSLLLPALRIATRFMTESSLLNWWKHTLYGRVTLDKYGRRHLVCTPFEATDVAGKQLHSFLQQSLPAVLQIRFHNLDKKGLRIDGCAFSNNASYLEFCCIPTKPTSWAPLFDTPCIVLHSQFLFSLKYLSKYGSAAEVENVNLRLAITLCHELAHVVWKFRVSRQVGIWAPDTEYMEPLHQSTEHLAELGHSWELYVFGGSIWTMDRPGYFASFYRPREGKADLSAAQTCVVVPQWWISIWSRAGLWSEFDTLFHLGQLRLPSEDESGYTLREKGTPGNEKWMLYKRGQPVSFHCRTPKASVFYLWHEVRPLLQRVLVQEEGVVLIVARKEKEEDCQRKMQKMCNLHREFYELLVSQEFVDESSPRVLRERRLWNGMLFSHMMTCI